MTSVVHPLPPDAADHPIGEGEAVEGPEGNGRDRSQFHVTSKIMGVEKRAPFFGRVVPCPSRYVLFREGQIQTHISQTNT